jgi:NAD(P)-dependent dehydrogenase (short-subunit alcohol dehydrogenase family)
MLGARRRAALQTVSSSAANRGEGRVTILTGDVQEDGSAEALFRHALEGFESLQGAFNNAGIVGDMVPAA